MSSFLEPATLPKSEVFLRYFPIISFKVSEDFFHLTPPCIYAAATVNTLRSFFLNYINSKINHEKLVVFLTMCFYRLSCKGTIQFRQFYRKLRLFEMIKICD